jgi:uncharacterized protein YciI
MFVISLTYTAPEEVVDVHLPAHVEWMKQAVADGALLASGRKVPRTGGVIIAKAASRAEAEAFAASDPFVAEGVATFDITEVALGMTAPGLDALRG